ncbi:hypothetical protein [Streptomyces sp. NPDC058045]|uniref:hypothetical protein n=1 Tax=Streptomyces sp. NPDC058045 TaxID=3346311 RepID=UPI0036E83B6F
MSYDDDWYPPHLDGPEWVVPQPADCPNCPCHTARVCQGRLWHRAWPQHRGCPCEAAAVAADTPPATRTLTISLGGITRTVTAQAPAVGVGAGFLLTPRCFAASGGHLAASVVVPMVLAPAPETAPADQVTVDEHGTRWAIRLTASYGGAEVRIHGWHDA